ncbi:UDP-N-acetylmuramoyl-L-alanine--D-glutamate ligase [Clostridium sp. HMP27]|uniref:UDP-N-acetylmuramoyl-L-alanine--D-glutamate ligase n=1 Tax=Clostridium sp. HMP27 TaxID=1487921 RepID=UPI00052D89C8|nr:UDP-N-acetylmuramoyl-L-alanine--D-glutamate ligase [Clostridium sp. HMP27]KGK83946.1 UDP-N-acetylmuramoyl-L-alanyl-D-glutamate synthetase [Clostridium sp. HMP27]
MNRQFDEFKKFIEGKETAVVGIGVSNRPLIDLLVKLNAKVTAFDKKSEAELGEIVESLKTKGVKLVVGKDYLTKLKGYEVIFKTPSMRIDSPELLDAKREGAYITSEMEEFVKYCPGKIYGVTGSDGKTTTTTLIYKMLSEQGYKTWVGGNIGTPLFSKIEEISKEDRVVLELSSFQLMTIHENMEVALITNLSPNHLDMHNGMEEYINAKKNIYLNQTNDNLLVLNRDNSITRDMVNEAKGRVFLFSISDKVDKGAYYYNDKLYVMGKEVCFKNEVKLKGMHNIENLLAAFCCVYEDVSLETMKKVATTFAGVEHRMEFIRELNGVEYYNDSIASSPTRTLAGLKAFGRPVILIAGGYDKKISFDILAEEGYPYIKTLILLGVTKNKIREAFQKVIEKNNMPLRIIMVESFEEAIKVSRDEAKEGDIVTLSPACASFDMFPNFEVRGNKFKEIINGL